MATPHLSSDLDSDEEFEEELLEELQQIANLSEDEESEDDSPITPVATWVLNPNYVAQTETCSQIHTSFHVQHLTGISSPLDILETIISKEMLDSIIFFTNKYAKTQNEEDETAFRNYQPVTIEEMWLFLGINLHMGLIKKPSYKDYWSCDELLSTPIFSSTISRDRFETILRALHFTDKADCSSDRMLKLGPFLPSVNEKFKQLISPGRNLCVDESLLPFHGRLSFKQFIPSKRARFGIKCFELVDCESNFIISILPYIGKNTKLSSIYKLEKFGYGGAVVFTLIEDYLGQYRQVTIDNWFMSPFLAEELLARKTYCLGTCRKSRKGMPKFQKKQKVGDVEVYVKSGMMVERWKDKREVIILSTAENHGMIGAKSKSSAKEKMKPLSVLSYNNLMGGVDNVDRVTKPYAAERKTIKWFKKFAFHVIDLCVFNSFVLHKRLSKNEKQAYKTYLLILIRDIYKKYHIPRKSLGRPRNGADVEARCVGQHLPQKMLKSNGKSSFSPCFFCKLKGNRRETAFKCGCCKKRFCIDSEENCFLLYHTLKILPKKATATCSDANYGKSAFLLFCKDNKSIAINKMGKENKSATAVSTCLLEMWKKSSKKVKNGYRQKCKPVNDSDEITSSDEDMDLS